MSTTPVPPAPIEPAHTQAPYELASPAVVLAGVNPRLLGFVTYLGLWHRLTYNKPLVITSGKDAVHAAGSLHGIGKAVDVRITDLDAGEAALFFALLAFAAPGNLIAVFDERALPGEPHIHLEYHGS